MTAPAVPVIAVTDVGGIAHLVTDDAMAAGRRAGRYVAVCGAEVIPARPDRAGVRLLPCLLEGRAVTLACPGGRPDQSTGVTDPQLAVLLRQTQWALDDAAHDFPAGRVTPQRREELAGILEALAAIVRVSAPDRGDVPDPANWGTPP